MANPKIFIWLWPGSSSMNQIKSMVGKVIILEPKEASVIKDTCFTPNYELQREGYEFFDDNFRIRMNTLRIKNDSAYILSIECNSEPHYANKRKERDFSNDFIIFSELEMFTRNGGDCYFL